MSFFEKVKEMLGVDDHKHRKDVPEQTRHTADETTIRPREHGGGEFDDLRTKAEDAAKGGIDKAAEAADKATGGKYTERIDKGAAAARDAANKIDGKQDEPPR